MSWCSESRVDTLSMPLQNHRPDVEVRFADSFTKPRRAHGDIFYVNIAVLWWMYAGALSSAPG